LLAEVVAYLQSRPTEDEFVPKFIAKAINESEVSVITAMRFLEEAGAAKQWFGVFCSKTDVPLDKFATLQAIPNDLPCCMCDERHSHTDHSFKVEVLYTVDRKKLDDFGLPVRAA
jgi:hypothetical protein